MNTQIHGRILNMVCAWLPGGNEQGARIFDLEKTPAGNFELVEGCDGYYRISLSPRELFDLGKELCAASGIKD